MARRVIVRKSAYATKVSREVIINRSKSIKPVKEYSDGLHYMKGVKIFSPSFLWYPTKGKKAERLEILVVIKTHHRISRQGRESFMPRVSEVLSQIPKRYLKMVTAFRIIQDSHRVDSIGLHDKKEQAEKNGYHVGETVLYVSS